MDILNKYKCPLSTNHIGSEDSIFKIKKYITDSAYTQSLPILMRLTPSKLDEILHGKFVIRNFHIDITVGVLSLAKDITTSHM